MKEVISPRPVTFVRFGFITCDPSLAATFNQPSNAGDHDLGEGRLVAREYLQLIRDDLPLGEGSVGAAR